MFSFFKRKEVKQVAKEKANQVYIDGDQLFYEDHNTQETVFLNQLSYAYATVLGETAYLYLKGDKTDYISIEQTGFAEAYRVLSDRFGFDDNLFYEIVNQSENKKARIWIKQVPKNYATLEAEHNDFTQGFEVLSKTPQFISWDTTYEEMLTLGLAKAGDTEFTSDYHTFLYPVRIGNLIINDFGFNAGNDRQNIAVLSYSVDLNNGLNTDGSFEELKAFFMNLIPTNLDEAGYEREDQKHLSFERDLISFNILYDYNDDSSYDSGSTYFYLNNQRDYTSTVLPKRDDLVAEYVKLVVFEDAFEFSPNYENDNRVTARPILLDELANTKQVSYYNEQTNRIGFSNENFSIEFDRKEVASIIIQNVLPAKGGGYATLDVMCVDDNRCYIFFADLYAFDNYAKQIQKTLGVIVQIPEPSYNC